ncbi:Nuclear pore membrane glycoprotein 210-like protein [Thelohanellus kitauei]|uniref:Nuclear pore membrane glycoprotein 210-like protein n=1 Tax=Thelohanellus kitauei TaxID=669202 RepID=A0A0C2N271_THEKT|nr:Nuclear pore membrane glycoprotein 210-like protein [Thelohanellus kitauei]
MRISSYILGVLVLGTTRGWGHTLSAATILLPTTSIGAEPVIYDLAVHGDGGCFRVSNTRDDVVKIQPIESSFSQEYRTECVRAIRLTSVSAYNSRESSVITFIDQSTGMTFKAHVFVDSIRKFDIVTRRRTLYIGDVKEKIEVVAYDNYGNVFSSLFGALFEWKVSCDNCRTRPPVSIVPFQPSNYEIHDSIANIESRGSRGNMILLEALFKGEVVVSVRMLDDHYKNVEANVSLLVREYITLDPSDTQYYLTGGFYDVSVIRIVKSKRDEIKISPKTYTLNSSDTSVCSIHTNYKTIIAQSVGKAIISLTEGKDRPKESDIFQLLVYVVDPTHITLSCEGQENWLFELGRVYLINIQVYHHDHLLNVSKFSFNSNIIPSNSRLNITDIGRYGLNVTVLAAETGFVDLEVAIDRFSSIYKKDISLSEILTSNVQIEVIGSIKVLPEIMVIPFLSSNDYFYSYNAVGGSGRYTWQSSLLSLFTDRFDGKFLTPSKSGVFKITASDRMNRYISSSAILKVFSVRKISLLTEKSEYPVFEQFQLYVKLLGYDPDLKNDVEITHFHKGYFKINVSDNLFSLCEEDVGYYSYCLVSQAPGCSVVTLTLLNTSDKVSANVRICAFSPLEVVSQTQYAIPGSFIIVNLTGGPLSVLSKKTKSEVNLSSSGIFELHSSNLYELGSRIESFRFQCVKVGQENITFTSMYSYSSITAYRDIVEYRLICLEPENLKLTVHPLNNDPRCSSSPYVLSSHRNKVKFSVHTSDGFLIDDLSGFNVSFNFLPSFGVIKSFPRIASPVSNQVMNISGILVISPKVYRGHAKIMVIFSPKVEKYSFSIVFEVLVASDLKLSLSSLSLLSYKFNKRSLKFHGGSGNILISQKRNISQIKHKGSLVEITPLKTGFEVITFSDICSNVKPFKLEVYVTTLGRVEVKHPHKHLTNSSTPVEVVVYNNLDQIVPNEEQHLIRVDFNFMHDKPDEIVKGLNNENHHIVYKFCSFTPMLLDFIVEVSLVTNQSVKSKNSQIEMYDDVQIVPRMINMVPGMEIKLRTIGGPQFNVQTVFNVSTDCVVFSSANNSLNSISCCQETISACVVSMDSKPFEIYTCDSVPLSISEAIRVEIETTNNRYYQGTTVPASIVIFNRFGAITRHVSLSSVYNIEWSVEKSSHMAFEVYGDDAGDQVLMAMKKEGSSDIEVDLKIWQEASKRSISIKASKIIYILRNLSPFLCNYKVLIPTGIKYDLRNLFTNSFVSFRFTDKTNPGFSIDSKGILTATTYPSYALLVADVQDSRQDIQHRETVSIFVEVAEIAQIFIQKNTSENPNYLHALHIGREISYGVVAIDSHGRAFKYVPDTFLNISISPLGIIELLDVKEMHLKVRGLSLGKAYMFIDQSITSKTTRIVLEVGKQFALNHTQISIGDMITFQLPTFDPAQIEFSLPDIVICHQKDNRSWVIMGFGVGETLLQIKYEASTYDVLKISVSEPSESKFSENAPSPITEDGHNYTFAIESVSELKPGTTAQFPRYPFTCSIENGDRIPLKAVEGVDYKTGHICCLIKPTEHQDFDTTIQPRNITIVSAFIDQQGVEISRFAKTVLFLPKMSLDHSHSPINIKRCRFDDIRFTQLQKGEELEIKTDLPCIESSYHYDQNIVQTVIVFKIDKCFQIIRSSTGGYITITRHLTKQKLSFPFLLQFEELECLHDSAVIISNTFKIIVALLCIIIPIILYYQWAAWLQCLGSIINKLMALSSQTASHGQQNHPYPTPKLCSLKPDISSDDGSFNKELYTTRREFLNSSIK